MGYCMSYRRAINRGGLFGGYQLAGHPESGHYSEAALDSVDPDCWATKDAPVRASMVAGDLRRVEADQRDERHLAAYAKVAGITPEQAKAVLDAFFDGVPLRGGYRSDCVHMGYWPPAEE